METMRPNIEMAVACCLDSRHGGAFDNDTGCGKGGIERPGTVRPMFTALQRSNGSTTALKRVPQSRIKVWPQIVWLTIEKPPGTLVERVKFNDCVKLKNDRIVLSLMHSCHLDKLTNCATFY